MTKKDIIAVTLWFDVAIKNMLQKIDIPIKLQVARKFDEVFKFNEKV